MSAEVFLEGCEYDRRAAERAAVVEVGCEDEMGEILKAEDVVAVYFYGTVDRGVVVLRFVIVGVVIFEGLLTDDAELVVGGDGFEVDVGGCEEEVELGGGFFQVGYCVWGDGYGGWCFFTCCPRLREGMVG